MWFLLFGILFFFAAQNEVGAKVKREIPPAYEVCSDLGHLMPIGSSLPIWSEHTSKIGLANVRLKYPQYRGAGVSVAIIDEGIDFRNPLLGGGIGKGFKFRTGENFDPHQNPEDVLPDDMRHQHGTAVAHVIGANDFVCNNKIYTSFVPEANLLALKVGARNSQESVAQIRRALRWVLWHQKKFNIVAVELTVSVPMAMSMNGLINRVDIEKDSYEPELAALKELGVITVTPVSNYTNLKTISPQGIPPYIFEWPQKSKNVIPATPVSLDGRFTAYYQISPLERILFVGTPQLKIFTGPDLSHPHMSQKATSWAAAHIAGAAALLKSISILPEVNLKIDADDMICIIRDSGAPVSISDSDRELLDEKDLSPTVLSHLQMDQAIELLLNKRKLKRRCPEIFQKQD